ncbi:hypothetical protein LTR37_001534 [Vermiconidia calcicola]|uniref:Uncharacterized protein n=1 Tax=Vermiconidia calcicola TaxID=1690605 RepID=A0ACC3NVI7_9PEZI|nr:hypothetical protein LTR37_001534 [Vermiconidia calcicola]
MAEQKAVLDSCTDVDLQRVLEYCALDGCRSQKRSEIIEAIQEYDRGNREEYEATVAAEEAAFRQHKGQLRLQHLQNITAPTPAYIARLENSSAAAARVANVGFYKSSVELRNKIYEHVLPTQRLISNGKKNSIVVARKANVDGLPPLSIHFEAPILSTCRLTRFEALSSYYGRQSFRFVIHKRLSPRYYGINQDWEVPDNFHLALQWLETLGDRLQHIRFLEINVCRGFSKIKFTLTGKAYSATGLSQGNEEGCKAVVEAILETVKKNLGGKVIEAPKSRPEMQFEDSPTYEFWDKVQRPKLMGIAAS